MQIGNRGMEKSVDIFKKKIDIFKIPQKYQVYDDSAYEKRFSKERHFGSFDEKGANAVIEEYGKEKYAHIFCFPVGIKEKGCQNQKEFCGDTFTFSVQKKIEKQCKRKKEKNISKTIEKHRLIFLLSKSC